MRTDLSIRLHAYRRAQIRWQRTTVDVSPFTCYFTIEDPPDGIAVPDLSAIAGLADALDQLRASFVRRGASLRIRYLDAFAPHLGAQLQLAGLVEIENWPILICNADDLRPPPPVPGLDIVAVTRESSLPDIKEAWNANAWGYDMHAAPATDTQAEEFRRSLTNNCAFTARLAGHPVAAGMFDVIRDGITELAGITTLGPYRKRGIASYLSAHITMAAFAHGAEIAFLSPENHIADRIYRRIGYRPYTVERVYCSSTGCVLAEKIN